MALEGFTFAKKEETDSLPTSGSALRGFKIASNQTSPASTPSSPSPAVTQAVDALPPELPQSAPPKTFQEKVSSLGNKIGGTEAAFAGGVIEKSGHAVDALNKLSKSLFLGLGGATQNVKEASNLSEANQNFDTTLVSLMKKAEAAGDQKRADHYKTILKNRSNEPIDFEATTKRSSIESPYDAAIPTTQDFAQKMDSIAKKAGTPDFAVKLSKALGEFTGDAPALLLGGGAIEATGLPAFASKFFLNPEFFPTTGKYLAPFISNTLKNLGAFGAMEATHDDPSLTRVVRDSMLFSLFPTFLKSEGALNKSIIATGDSALMAGTALMDGASKQDAAVAGILGAIMGVSGLLGERSAGTVDEAKEKLKKIAADKINETAETKITPDSSPEEIKTAVKESSEKAATDREKEGLKNAKDILEDTSIISTESAKEKKAEILALAKDVATESGAKEKPSFNTKPEIPEDLKPLADEARKYKSAEDFVNSQKPKITDRIDNLIGIEKSYFDNNSQKLTVYYDKNESPQAINTRINKALADNRLIDSVKEIKFLSTDKGTFEKSPPRMDESQLTDFYNKVKEEPKFNSKDNRKSLKERPFEPKRVAEYRERLKLKGADPILVDTIITPSGGRAYGVSVGGNLSFERIVQEFTEDHEILHQVFQNLEKMRLFKDFDKEALLDEARAIYGDKPVDKLEEELALDFQQYVAEREAAKPTSFFGKIKEFFDRLWTSLKRIFKNPKDIEEFYRTLYEGTAKEETVIKNEMPPSFNRRAKNGIIDFRATSNEVQNFLEEVPIKDAFTDSGDLTLRTIQKLEGRLTVSKQFIEDLTNSGDIKQVERDLIRAALEGEGEKVNVKEFVDKVKNSLIPLKRVQVESPRYEDTTLPSELRGDVEKYTEHIYETDIPIYQTDPLHFSGINKKMFGWTRVEDMADGVTRRVIEVQNYIYQKNTLERESRGGEIVQHLRDKLEMEEGMTPNQAQIEIDRQIMYEDLLGKRQAEIKRLEQYNNPTSHFRKVREEIRRAAQEGKTKLQFPTGETAMKIEGLSNVGFWFERGSGYHLIEDNLKVGKEVQQAGNNEPWIITDVLEGGKFKAIHRNSLKELNPKSPRFEEAKLKYSEQFDISGKVDTNNPIYKFYEKDLGRYLKNNYDATLITDDKGVTWYEMDVDPREANLPVPAFNEKNPKFKSGDKEKDARDALAYAEKRVGVTPAMVDAKISHVREKIAEKAEPLAVPKIRVSGKDIELPEDLTHRQIEIEMAKERLAQDPAQQLSKYVAKSGDFKGELPEATGKIGKSVARIKNTETLKWIKGGDQIASSLGFRDSDDAREAWDVYAAAKEDLKLKKSQLKTDLADFLASQKDDRALDKMAFQEMTEAEKARAKEEKVKQKIEEKDSLDNWKNFISTYVEEQSIPKSVAEFEPPKVRGGLVAPKLDLVKFKDVKAPFLNRETFERNIEAVAPKKDAAKIKEFAVDPLKDIETKRVEFTNDLRKEIETKIVKELGIKKGSKEDEYVQRFGEGKEAEGGVSLDTLKATFPTRWQKIQEAADFFREKYDELIDRWNAEREKYGYPPIGKRKDYFRHFEELNESILRFGLAFKDNQLPTSIAGLTENFKPGKPFSTAEMRRLGKKTSFSALKGMDNYIDSVSKQIFHTETVQRFRALEKYIRMASDLPLPKDEVPHLPNFVSNIMDYANHLAGKKGRFDRAAESFFGRGIFTVANWLQRRTSANLVGLNFSSGLTNLIAIATQVPSTTAKIPYIRGLLDSVTIPFKKNFAEIEKGVTSKFLTRRFPKHTISNTTFENAKQMSQWFFDTLDKFSVHAGISAKYYENLGKGMTKEEAIKAADEYAGKVFGDRSFGQAPVLFQNRSIGFLTQFQLEVNNMYSFLKKDIPRQYAGSKPKIISAFLQFMIYSYLFNEGFEKITGRRPTIDPINAILTVAGLNNNGQGLPAKQRFGKAAKDIGENLPFSGIFLQGGRIPLASGLPNLSKLYNGETTLAAEAQKPAFLLAPPFGGGQVKKTLEGITAYLKGQVKSKTGKTNYTVPKTTANAIRMALFGKYATPEGEKFFSEQDRVYAQVDKSKKAAAEKTSLAEDKWNELKQLSETDKAAANDMFAKIEQDDPALADKIYSIAQDDKRGLTQLDRAIKQLGVENGDRARYIFDNVSKLKTNEEKNAYVSALDEKGLISDTVYEQLQELIQESKTE